MPTTANVPGDWKFRILLREARPRRLILEGNAFPPYERPYHDALYFYAVVGLDYLSLEVSRDFDGDRLLEYLFVQLGRRKSRPGSRWAAARMRKKAPCCWWNGASRPTGARPCSGVWKRLWANPWPTRPRADNQVRRSNDPSGRIRPTA